MLSLLCTSSKVSQPVTFSFPALAGPYARGEMTDDVLGSSIESIIGYFQSTIPRGPERRYLSLRASLRRWISKVINVRNEGKRRSIRKVKIGLCNKLDAERTNICLTYENHPQDSSARNITEIVCFPDVVVLDAAMRSINLA